MKIALTAVQAAFEESLRRLDHQVWDRCEGYVAFANRPTAGLVEQSLGLDFDLDQDVPDDEKGGEIVGGLSNRITRAAESLAQLPGIYAIRALKAGLGRVTEVTVPAGCDPLDPAEIRSAVKRARDHIDYSDSVAILIPAGAQDAFFAALDTSTPPTIEGVRVRFHASTELLDERVVEELFPEASDETVAGTAPTTARTQEEYAEKLGAAARRSPWFILPWTTKDQCKPFRLLSQDRPKLTGPKLTAVWRSTLEANQDARVVKVAASKLVLATSVR